MKHINVFCLDGSGPAPQIRGPTGSGSASCGGPGNQRGFDRCQPCPQRCRIDRGTEVSTALHLVLARLELGVSPSAAGTLPCRGARAGAGARSVEGRRSRCRAAGQVHGQRALDGRGGHGVPPRDPRRSARGDVDDHGHARPAAQRGVRAGVAGHRLRRRNPQGHQEPAPRRGRPPRATDQDPAFAARRAPAIACQVCPRAAPPPGSARRRDARPPDPARRLRLRHQRRHALRPGQHHAHVWPPLRGPGLRRVRLHDLRTRA